MKLPRWLMIAMRTTSLVAVVVAAGWWWVMWPERTAREFLDRLTRAEADASWEEMLRFDWTDDPAFGMKVEILSSRTSSSEIEPKARSLVELLLGRQWFMVFNDRSTDEPDWGFNVERGAVDGVSSYVMTIYLK